MSVRLAEAQSPIASPGADSAAPVVASADPHQAMWAALSRLIERAIPLEYEKQKDWGATKEIATGLRFEGSGFDARLKRRKREVPHGVWKHYRLRLVDPAKHLAIELANLRAVAPGRMAFTLHATAKLDAWARAKIYQYGVHIIALEMESDMRVRLVLDGEFNLALAGQGGEPVVTVMPTITRAELAIEDFHLRRVSNADGPVIRELGDGVRAVVEDELNGPKLVEKLNRAIEKKRDRLTFRLAELLETDWRAWAPWLAAPVGSVSRAETGPTP
jgi:hypothetical protein